MSGYTIIECSKFWKSKTHIFQMVCVSFSPFFSTFTYCKYLLIYRNWFSFFFQMYFYVREVIFMLQLRKPLHTSSSMFFMKVMLISCLILILVVMWLLSKLQNINIDWILSMELKSKDWNHMTCYDMVSIFLTVVLITPCNHGVI